MDCSLPGSIIHGIFQAKVLDWGAISFSNTWKWKWSCSLVSDSVWPHRRQPNRLLCPWDSLGKNTGMGCHFLLQCMKVKSESEVAQSCLALRDPMDRSLPGSTIHGIFQAGVLEWSAIIVTATAKSLHSCLTLCDPIDGSPSGSSVPGILQARILEWVAISFSNACMPSIELQSDETEAT